MSIKKNLVLMLQCAGLLLFSANAIAAGCQEQEGHDEGKKILDVGGQVRLRGDYVQNQNLGDLSFSPGTHDEQLLSRTRLNMAVEPASWVRGFVQGQYYNRAGGDSRYSKVNVYQAYVDLDGQKYLPLSARLGRQELCYGSGFFLGANDFYDGLVWDAAKFSVALPKKINMDFIAAYYVNLNNHKSEDKPAIYGMYSDYAISQNTDLDFYFFYHKGGFSFFHSDLPDYNKWYTVGARLAGELGSGFDYEVEPLYQFGSIDNTTRLEQDKISAYGGHVEAGYTFKSRFNPRIFALYAYGSGDNNSEDSRYREFHGNVYNDHYIVGDTSLIADLSGLTVGSSRASGMHIVGSGLSFDINPKLNVNADYHYFIADKTPADISKNLGGELNLILTYKLLKNLNITASANRFITEKFFNDAAGSGKDVGYYYIQTQLEF